MRFSSSDYEKTESRTHLKIPVKPADVDTGGVSVVVLEGGVIDDVDNRTYDSPWVAGYPVQQGFKPS